MAKKTRTIKCKTCMVKRGGEIVDFDERKVYASCYSACLSSHREKKKAEEICGKISADIKKWIMKKKLVTSDEIFKKTTELLKKYDKNAAFMYETHRDIS